MLKHKAERTEDGKIRVTLVDLKKERVMNCSLEQYDIGMEKYHVGGEFIQSAFDFLSSTEREFFLTGMSQV